MLLAAALCPAAGWSKEPASPPLRLFPHQHGVADTAPPASDGMRYIVINVSPGVVRIYDTVEKSTRDVEVRRQCSMRDVTVNYALVGCTDESRPYLLRLKTGALEAAPKDIGTGGRTQWFAIGRHWLLGGYMENRPVDVYARWTGDAVQRNSFDAFSHPPYDLDSPRLTSYSERHRTFVRRPPFVMKDVLLSQGRQGPLVLDRSDGRRVVLSDCACTTRGELGDGIAIWREGYYGARAYDIAARRHFAWRLDDPNYSGPALLLATRRHVAISVTPIRPPYTTLLFWARVRK